MRRVRDVEDVDAELSLDRLREREQLRDRGVEVRRTPGRRARRCAAQLPNVFGAGDENTDVSNQSAPGPTAPSTAGVPVTSGRCVLPGALSVAALAS